METRICDAATATDKTLKLLHADTDRRVLIVSKHTERPIKELVLCHRKCTANPSKDDSRLVRISAERPDAFLACHRGEYIGNNIWGRGFYKPAVYCQGCGFALTGPQIDHVVIIQSDDDEWNRMMVEQCEMGACWHEGKNLGMTYELGREPNAK